MTSPGRDMDVRESRDLRVCMQCQERPAPTEFICTDCALALCVSCRRIHASSARFSGHHILPYVETSRCTAHGKRQILKCTDCKVECCIVCANFGLHKGHKVEDKSEEVQAKQTLLEQECEETRKNAEDKIALRLEQLQMHEREITHIQEIAVKMFLSQVTERKNSLLSLNDDLTAKLEIAKTTCENKSLEELQELKTQLSMLNAESTPELPASPSFHFSQSVQSALPQIPVTSSSPPTVFPVSHSHSYQTRSARTHSAEYAFEEAHFLEDDFKADPEDLRYPVESEVRNPTTPPRVRPVIYTTVNDEASVVCFDLVTEETRMVTIPKICPKFCSLTLLEPGMMLITGGGERPCRSTFTVNTHDWTCRDRADMLTSRNYHSSVFFTGQAVVLGGFNQIIQHSCECYSPSEDQWIDIASLNIARGALGACVYNEAIYSIGGWDGHQEISSIERLRSLVRDWELLTVTLPLSSQCNAVAWDSYLLVFAYQAEKVYLIEQEEVMEYGSFPNEAWVRPELVRYQDLIYGFKSDGSKALCYDVRRKKYRSVTIERRLTA